MKKNALKSAPNVNMHRICSSTCLVVVMCLFVSCIYDPQPLDQQKVRCVVSISGMGHVAGIPDTVLERGTVVTLIASPDSGYFFAGWNIVNSKFTNPLTISIVENISIAASFVKKPEKLIQVQSNGKSFTMGTDDKSAPAFERPAHKVYFDYNYYLSAKEVTVQEYRSLTSSWTSAQPDSVPVGAISWYDAVLYCNEMSKKSGYDTVYTYKSVCRDKAGCPFILEDWKIHYDRAGFRLPTEAEWEYACRASTTTESWWGAGSPDSNAWYTLNSGGSAHPVGIKNPNPWGFYDMSGNVAEWVNDWLNYYDSGVDTNPIGPTHLLSEVFELTWERPVRGGSYRLGVHFLRTTTRQGPYETSAFLIGEDIGFRVAFGPFKARNMIDNSDTSKLKDSISVKIHASKTDLIGFTGTSSVKCAFVYERKLDRRLYISDYTGAGISLFRCGKDSSVYNPVISPDGKFVAYSTSGEGFGGVCTLTVRPASTDTSNVNIMKMPGTIPRWWVSPDKVDTFLIFTTGASMNSQPKWHTEKTMKLRMRNGKAFGQPEVLWGEASYHGGMSADGRFIATGYPVARLVDLQINDTNIYYFWPPFSGRDDYTQLCNVSMSPSLSEPGEVMLLDFGYPRVSTVVGSSYGFHEVIFVCNTNMMNEKHVSKWFRVPSYFEQWNYPEWSNHPDFASALACSNDSNVIEIIKCDKGEYLPLLTGENVREMHLWIDPGQLPVVNDPYRYFGRYDLPIQAGGQLTLSRKLHTFWRYRDEWEIAILGSSTAYYGFEPSVMSRKAINLGCHGSDIMCAAAVAEYYCLPHASKLKAIVVDLMSYSFDLDSYKNNPRLTGLLDSKGFELDSSNHFYRSGLPQTIVSKINSWGPEQWPGFDSLGFHKEVKDAAGWGSVIIDKGDYRFDDSVVQASITIVKRMALLAASNKVHVLIVNTPQHPGYAATKNMGRLGPSVETYKMLADVFIAFEKENPYFHYYDANNYGNHDYSDEDAFDCNHLTPKGGAKLALRVDSLINTYTLKQ